MTSTLPRLCKFVSRMLKLKVLFSPHPYDAYAIRRAGLEAMLSKLNAKLATLP